MSISVKRPPVRRPDQLGRCAFDLFAERISELMQLVEEVAFRKLDQRLANLLLGKGRQLHTTHQQLADELGSVREMVSRLLKGFADQGLVRLGRWLENSKAFQTARQEGHQADEKGTQSDNHAGCGFR